VVLNLQNQAPGTSPLGDQITNVRSARTFFENCDVPVPGKLNNGTTFGRELFSEVFRMRENLFEQPDGMGWSTS
jgi:hypothetical protein